MRDSRGGHSGILSYKLFLIPEPQAHRKGTSHIEFDCIDLSIALRVIPHAISSTQRPINTRCPSYVQPSPSLPAILSYTRGQLSFHQTNDAIAR